MSKKILVIDDDPHIVELLKNRLVACSYQVVTAHDGEEGLLQVQKEHPDLIIVDVLMPKMDGYTFVRTLKRNEAIKATPVIVLTAKDKMKDLFELEGVKDYMVKPYRPEDLLKKVRSNLGEE
ncbi:MAG TPA: response regulator [Verrucomicrobiae bacterium]|nr:response regulator [Verrucomicrobiae bacterium]